MRCKSQIMSSSTGPWVAYCTSNYKVNTTPGDISHSITSPPPAAHHQTPHHSTATLSTGKTDTKSHRATVPPPNMSVTTTDNPITTAISRDVLQDYDIHLTGDDNNDTAAPPDTDSRPPAPAPAAAVSNLPGWPADYRGVPPYRPINMNLDRSQRPWGGNPVGDVFVFTMLHGVWLNAVRYFPYSPAFSLLCVWTVTDRY